MSLLSMRPSSVSTLPALDDTQRANSQALVQKIHDAIRQADGWITFSDYMRLALYTPQLGYYSGQNPKFGAAGDFITAPEISPLFAQSVAQPVAQVLAACNQQHKGQAALLEVGAGSGKLVADLLVVLEQMDALPRRYYILELSADLAARQRETLMRAVPHLIDRVEWLSALPQHFIGCMIGNEVLDAMPCQLVVWQRKAGQWWERGVAESANSPSPFCWADRPLQSNQCDAIAGLEPFQAELPDGYVTEIQPEAAAFTASLAQATQCGAMLLFDYGFAAAEYYHSQRCQGTLMCHYRHHSHDNPFHLPGQEDITTHINFSHIWRSGEAAGWQLEGYTTQGTFLVDAGIMESLLSRHPADDGTNTRTASYFADSAAVQKLINPAEMGELFKVIAFSKDLELSDWLMGFRQGDRSGSL